MIIRICHKSLTVGTLLGDMVLAWGDITGDWQVYVVKIS
jgi:hypothetical protein